MEGNSAKVNSIVDKIVESNNSFKLKSSLEQDKEKDSMAKSINTALSALNEVGKDLVLQDLSVDPDEKFKGFIDSVGNIDISGLTKFTATMVKAKIEEAEKEGLNLNSGQAVFSSNKLNISEGILTAVAIDTMIKSFDNLSASERQSLMDNLEKMTFTQRRNLANTMTNSLKNVRNNFSSDKDKTIVDIMINVNNRNANRETEYTSEEAKLRLEILKQQRGTEWYESFIKENNLEESLRTGDFIRIFRFYEDEGYKLSNSIIEKGEKGKSLSAEEQKSATALREDYEAFEILNYSQELGLGSTLEEASKSIKAMSKEEYIIVLQKATELGKQNESQSVEIASREVSYNVERDVSKQTGQIAQKNNISQEIEQLPAILGKANFSQEEIKEALKIYKGTLESLESDDIEKYIEYINNGKKIEVQDEIKDFFIEDGISQEIAEVLSKIDFNGYLFEILGNEQQRTEFFEQLEQLTQPTQEQQPIQDEHTTEYYSSQNEPLQIDETAEKIAREVQARGGSSNDITNALVKEAEKRTTEQTQQAIQEEQPKVAKAEQTSPPTSGNPTTPEEHTQENASLPEQEAIAESHQSTALVEQDNSFIGKIKRAMSKIKSNIKTKVSNFFGKKENITEEDKTTSSEQGKTTSPKLYNTLDRYTIENNNIEKNAFEHLKDNGIVPKENESDKELGD